MAHPTAHVDAPFPTAVAISPTKADAYAQCPRRYALQYLRRASAPSDPPSPAQQRGQIIHRALAALNRALMHGDVPDIEALIHGLRPAQAMGNGSIDDIAERTDAALHGYADYLADEDLRVRAAEQFVPTPSRRVAGHPGVAVMLAGKIDVILERPDGFLAALDYKTGSILPLADDLSRAPSSAIYTLLADYWLPDAPGIAVVHLLPHLQESVSVHLDEAHIEAGRAIVRRMAVALAAGTTDDKTFSPTPGEHCGTCRWLSSCPAHERPNWSAAAF